MSSLRVYFNFVPPDSMKSFCVIHPAFNLQRQSIVSNNYWIQMVEDAGMNVFITCGLMDYLTDITEDLHFNQRTHVSLEFGRILFLIG